MLVGVTQVLSVNDIVQSNLTYSVGSGYYNDPYKAIDVRPDHRDQLAWLTRWNDVLAYCEALPHGGGSGAVLVLLRGR